MDVTPVRAYVAQAASTSRSLIRVPLADTSLPATFAWLLEPAASPPVSVGSDLDRTATEPVPDIDVVLRQFQDILDQLAPQADEGDLSGLAEEIADWAPYRSNATRPLIDEA